ncbi:MAG TPA: SIS domain-containing protein [Thermoanaerobaculia bacterium]|nr:SIS domain-containing protein [Thermoanaerobaculia bacterium]
MSLKSEIFEQPAVLDRLLRTQAGPARDVARSIRSRDVHWVLIAARGSSDHAALYAKYLWGSRNGLPVALAAPSLYTLYSAPPRLQGAFVVGISQSGQSPDIVSVLADARRQGAPTLAITNDLSSPLAQEAEMVLDLGSGPERAIAATKTYTTQLLSIALLSVAMSGEKRGEEAGTIERVPELVQQALALDGAIEQAAQRYRSMTQCVVLGRGFNYATAAEWSLKLKELTSVVAEPYSSADFRHGPVAILTRGFPVLAVVPDGAVLQDMLALLAPLVEERGVELVAVSNHPQALALAHTPLGLPTELPEWLSPLVGIVPAQLFCYHLACAMGRDPEAPPGLSKVTRTW